MPFAAGSLTVCTVLVHGEVIAWCLSALTQHYPWMHISTAVGQKLSIQMLLLLAIPPRNCAQEHLGERDHGRMLPTLALLPRGRFQAWVGTHGAAEQAEQQQAVTYPRPGPLMLFLHRALAHIPLYPSMQPGQGRFISCIAAALAQRTTVAVPRPCPSSQKPVGLQAASMGPFIPCVPRCHHSPLPMLKGPCVCTISPWAGSSQGTKHHLFPLAETGAPGRGAGWGQQHEAACEGTRTLGKSQGQRTHVGSCWCALGSVLLPLHKRTWDLPSQLLPCAPSAL